MDLRCVKCGYRFEGEEIYPHSDGETITCPECGTTYRLDISYDLTLDDDRLPECFGDYYDGSKVCPVCPEKGPCERHTKGIGEGVDCEETP